VNTRDANSFAHEVSVLSGLMGGWIKSGRQLPNGADKVRRDVTSGMLTLARKRDCSQESQRCAPGSCCSDE
jgi:hypothetical protein